MIFCNLKGGFANMLFQIAGVTSLGINNNHEVSFPNLDTHLSYLNNENTHNPFLKTAHEYKDLNVFKNLKTTQPVSYDSYYSYPFFYKDIKITGENILVDGFFQSEKYIANNSEYIKDMLKLTTNHKEYIIAKYGNVLQNSTSIHIRRGDYVNNKLHHPVLPVDYFRQAINLTKNKTNKYLIFSDDISWCKNIFQGNKFIFIEGEKDYIDFYTMSYCNNNIISNSSFSWMSAWLNINKEKTVISPLQWFGKLINENTQDLIPDSWIKI